MVAPLAFAGPAWAEVCDKMGPGTFNLLSVLILGVLLLAWLVGLAERWVWLSLPPAVVLALGGWLHLDERLALARGDDDPGLYVLEAAIREGCRTASQGPGWLLLGLGGAMALTAIVDRVRGPR